MDHTNVELVSKLLADQFPALAGLPVRRLGAGWDHEVFTAGPAWVLRFPRSAERVPWLTREISLMDLVSAALGPLVPRFELIGRPSAEYPYPFVGYRRVPGVDAGTVRLADPGGLAADIAAALSRLHRIDPAGIPPTPSGWEHESRDALRTGLVAVADVVRPMLAAPRVAAALRAAAEPYLAGRVSPPEPDAPRRFIHNDICADHVLVSRRSGRLTGLIDFTDAMAGDPVRDFVGLIGVAGYPFIEQVAARYDLPLGDGFGESLTWLTRTLTLTWLAECDDPAAAAKLTRWAERAFSWAAR